MDNIESTAPVKGYVSYDVRVTCPHCEKRLWLNKYPYDDDQTEYSLAEDELVLALFGTVTEPAKWKGFEIEYTCCGCNRKFKLNGFEL